MKYKSVNEFNLNSTLKGMSDYFESGLGACGDFFICDTCGYEFNFKDSSENEDAIKLVKEGKLKCPKCNSNKISKSMWFAD